MNITTKLTSSKWIKDNTVVQELVKSSNLDPHILMAQDFYLRPILGTELYNQVVNEVQANSGSTTGLTSTTIQTLVDNIQYPLSYFTIYEAFPYLAFKLTNNGVVKRTGEGNFNDIELSDLKFLRNDFLAKAKSYETDLRQFLADNKADYYITPVDCSTTRKRNLGGLYF